jgi:hypothetical protein
VALLRHLPIQKPSQKRKNLTFIGRRFRSPFFLCLTQILKAVTTGVVAAIALFWSNKPNPAIRANMPSAEVKYPQIHMGENRKKLIKRLPIGIQDNPRY